MSESVYNMTGKSIRRFLDLIRRLPEFVRGFPTSPETGAAPHVFFVVAAFMFITFAVWSSYGTLDIVSMAEGKVVPSSQVKTVQHLEGGIVKEIMVSEGEVVQPGQALIKLATTAESADVEELKTRLKSLELDIIRLETEASGSEELRFDVDQDSQYGVLAQQAIDLYQARRNRLNSSLTSQGEEVVQKKQYVVIIKTRIRQGEKTLALINEQVEISDKLISQKLSSRFIHIGLLKESASVIATLEESKADLLKSQAALRQAKSDLAGIAYAYDEEVRSTLDERRTKHAEFSERMNKYEDSLIRTIVRSPVAGIVKTLHVVTVGGVVSPGGIVLDIVPVDDRLVIEAQLPTQDVGYVNRGQKVNIRLASSDSQRFDKLLGTVERISPDALVTEDGFPYYKVRITSEKNYFEDGDERYNLFPGMSVMANIQTGQRTVLAYLLQPFWKSIDVALSER